MTMVFSDYVAGFLGQTRHGQSWHLKPFDPIKRNDGTVVTRGEGNHCTVEFNLLYRWHATVGLKDEEWTEKLLKEKVGPNWERATPEDFGNALRKLVGEVPVDPRKRTFGDLVRGADGKFSDEDLARVLQEATKQPAQRFGARGTPGALRHVEIASMNQARKWNVCTMNDFREFLGLRRFKTFDEWNSDPEIAEAARKLYKHIDRLELYPGIQAEENLAQTYGSGFMCGYTLMRAILSDAISLVRGDRFYTTDFTPANLTTWGFQDCQPFLANGVWGANLGRLFMRHLPREFPYNSHYSLYPFFTPKAMEDNIRIRKTVEVEGKLIHPGVDFSYPPSKEQKRARVETMKGIHAIFNAPEMFGTIYTENMEVCVVRRYYDDRLMTHGAVSYS
jgi:linoleate 10R-lipoxygenase